MAQQKVKLASRQYTSMVSLLVFILAHFIILAISITLIIFISLNYSFDYSFYFMILLAVIFGGVAGYLFVDGILFIKKLKINNSLDETCLEVDIVKQHLTVHGLTGNYQIPLNNVVKFTGDSFFTHSLLSLTYINKEKRKQIIEVGIFKNIRKTKKEIKTKLVEIKR